MDEDFLYANFNPFLIHNSVFLSTCPVKPHKTFFTLTYENLLGS